MHPIALAVCTFATLAALAAAPAWSQQAPARASTDWFRKAGYGVFVHYLTGLQNNREHVASLGRETAWDQCVKEFDTERFAATMAEVKAGYVIFTVMQITRHMVAPNATFDRISGYKPGAACATRDLVLDLHRSLSKRGIALMLYWTGDGPRADPRAGPAFGCGTPVTAEFVRKWASVVREYGERYGYKVAGYWVDGCYPFIGYDDEKLGIMADGLRAGNPRRIIALNRGVDPVVMSYTRHEDYTTGEQNAFTDVPVSRFIDGEQWHVLSYLGKGWGQAGVAYTKAELSDYVQAVTERGGVVSVDCLLYRDGSLDRSQVETLKYVGAQLRSGKPRPPVPPGNLAYRKQARLLSLDGTRELVVNSGVHFPRLGVDGRADTVALAGGEWPWTYHVDLVDTVDVRRVKVTFGSGYATHLQVQLSTNGTAWTTVADRDGLDGKPFEAVFEPTAARYVRIRALKPDGEGQPGTQMSVAEVEVYR